MQIDELFNRITSQNITDSSVPNGHHFHIYEPYIFAYTMYCPFLPVQGVKETRNLSSRGLVLSGNVLDRDLNVLLGEVHLSCEGAMWLPLARGARSALLQHLVNLLECKTLGLGNEEVGEED